MSTSSTTCSISSGVIGSPVTRNVSDAARVAEEADAVLTFLRGRPGEPGIAS
jgi:hypothetical protein